MADFGIQGTPGEVSSSEWLAFMRQTDDDVVLCGGFFECFAAHPLRAMVEHDFEVWAEPFELARPVADDGCWGEE